MNIKASGVNFSELMYRMGVYNNVKSKPPVVLGAEGSGVVCEVGEGVDNLQVRRGLLLYSCHHVQTFSK